MGLAYVVLVQTRRMYDKDIMHGNEKTPPMGWGFDQAPQVGLEPTTL